MIIQRSALIRITNIAVFLFVMFLFFIYEREELLTNMLSEIDNYGSPLRNICLIILALTLTGCSLYGRWSGNKLFLCYLLLTIYCIIITAIIVPPKMESLTSYIAMVVKVALPFLLCHFMYNAALRLSTKTILQTVGLVIALLGLVYSINFVRVLRFMLLENYRGGGPYLFLMFLPFIMLFTKKYVKTIFIIITLLFIATSMKRGATLAGLLSLTTYYIVGTLYSKDSRPFKKILLIVGIPCFLAISFFIFEFLSDGVLLERFANITNDGGSHRDLVYETVIGLIANSDAINFTFGHGWDSVALNSPLGISAHNDYLEYFYDCGIIAFALLCTFIAIIFHTTRKLIKNKSPFAPAFAACCMIIVINTMISHIFLYTWYISAFALFWGYYMGIEKKSKNMEQATLTNISRQDDESIL